MGILHGYYTLALIKSCVENFNPAWHLYERLRFIGVGQHGFYYEMELGGFLNWFGVLKTILDDLAYKLNVDMRRLI